MSNPMPQQGSQSPRTPAPSSNRKPNSVNYFFLSKPIHVPAQNLDGPTVAASLQEAGYDPEAIRDILEHGIRGPATFADRDPCEELTFPPSKLERYAHVMSEIERRLEVIKDIHANIPLKKNYVRINAEIIASQIRRILELFTTSFLMITNHKKAKSKQLIPALLKSKRLLFPDELSKKKIKKIYDECNNISHSESAFELKRQKAIKFSLDFNNVFEEIHNLLMSHAVYCSDGEICLRFCDSTGRKFVALMEIDSNNLFIVNQVIETESMEARDKYFEGSRSDIDYPI